MLHGHVEAHAVRGVGGVRDVGTTGRAHGQVAGVQLVVFALKTQVGGVDAAR